MNDPVQASIDAAKAAANQAAPAGAAPQVFQPQAGAVVTAGAKGAKLAVATMQKTSTNSLQVDHFLGVKEHGMIINFPNDDPRKNTLGTIALQPLTLLVDFAKDFNPKYSVRANIGAQVKFFHSYDRIFLDDGVTPWDQVITRCKQSDPKCKGDYPSVDIAGVLVNPAVNISGQQVVEAGKRVGFSTSTMNWEEFQQLYQKLVAADLVIEYDDNTVEGKVLIKVFGYVKANKGGIRYGAYNFEIIGSGENTVVGTQGTVQQPAPQVQAQVQQPVQQPQPVVIDQIPPTAAAQLTAAGIIPGVGGGADPGISGAPKRSRKAAGTA